MARLKSQPSCRPSCPTCLLNGQLGIAVGMATNIPPHNLTELVDAEVQLIDKPDSTLDDLLQHIKGPDFPTGGVIYGKESIRTAYATGRGGVVTRGVAEVVEGRQGPQPDRYHRNSLCPEQREPGPEDRRSGP